MLVPLVYTDSLPLFRVTDLHIQPPLRRVAAPPETQAAAERAPTNRTSTELRKLPPFTQIPKKIEMIVDVPLEPSAGPSEPYVPGAILDLTGSARGIPASIGHAPPPPPDPELRALEKVTKVERPVERLRVGGVVQAARLVKRVMPVYPALARQARVSGIVQLVGVIGKDGTVQQLQVVGGHPLLVTAAVDAVKQWVYKPTMLNGDPVEVIAPIEVHFTLGQ